MAVENDAVKERLKQVKYGKNKDGDSLPQINLALLFGEKSGLPFYYRKLAGNIPDVKTVTELIREPDILGYKKVKLVMDRGYYSADNINGLYKQHYKYSGRSPEKAGGSVYSDGCYTVIRKA